MSQYFLLAKSQKTGSEDILESSYFLEEVKLKYMKEGLKLHLKGFRIKYPNHTDFRMLKGSLNENPIPKAFRLY